MSHWVTTNVTEETRPFGVSNIYDDARLIANEILNCNCNKDDPDCEEFTMLVNTILHDWQLPIPEQPVKWDAFEVGFKRAMKRVQEVQRGAA